MNETGVILLVEDDKNILRTNRRILESEGFTVLCAERLSEARQRLAEQTPDVLVLDIMLPDGRGLDFCAEIRESTAAPVLFLTALDEKHEIIQGLVAGGNDYITKPYDVDEFVARVKAQLALARMNQQKAERSRTITRGPLTLDTVAGRAFLSGKDMLLSPKEFALLRLLVQSEGKALSKEYLYEAVWKLPAGGDARAVKTHLSGVRGKLAGSGFAILSTRGEGYRFHEEMQDKP